MTQETTPVLPYEICPITKDDQRILANLTALRQHNSAERQALDLAWSKVEGDLNKSFNPEGAYQLDYDATKGELRRIAKSALTKAAEAHTLEAPGTKKPAAKRARTRKPAAKSGAKTSAKKPKRKPAARAR